MSGDRNQGRPLKTVKTAFRVVEIVQTFEGAEIADIANHLNLARSTVHGYVTTLEQDGYLTYEDGVYHLGMEFLNKGGHVRNRKPEYEIIISKVNDLADQTDERAQLIVEEYGLGTYIHTATGDNAVHMNARIGKQSQLHASAAGKAILACLPEKRVTEIIDRHGLPSFTPETITAQDELDDELKAIHDRGYAINDQESVEGLRSIGAPIVSNETVIGAISISGPAHRMKGDWFTDEIPDIVLGATNELQLNISY